MLKLNRIEHGTNSEVIEKIFYVLLPDARTVLDVTYGRGNFWNWPHKLELTTNDLNPETKAQYHFPFTNLPFIARSFDVVVFDPPYQTDHSSKGSIMSHQFGTYKNIQLLERAVCDGVIEAYRIARKGIVIKVQDYIHASRLIEMTKWVRDTLHEVPLYDIVHLESTSKIDTHTLRPLSVRSNATTFMIFRKDTPVHKRRYF